MWGDKEEKDGGEIRGGRAVLFILLRGMGAGEVVGDIIYMEYTPEVFRVLSDKVYSNSH